jgi:hypothetical protein
MNTSIPSMLSRLPRGRRLGRAVIHRWPALAVAAVTAALPLGVVLAAEQLHDFGPSRFVSDGTLNCGLTPTFSQPCAAVNAYVSGNLRVAIRALGTIEAGGLGDPGDAIHALTTNGTGVLAKASGSGTAIQASSANGTAISGQANRTAGTFAAGVFASGDEAVVARGTTSGIDATAKGTAVSGISDNEVGGLFGGKEAPIRMFPASTPGAPTSGVHHRGELYVDSAGLLFYCSADGTPGTWHQVAFKN